MISYLQTWIIMTIYNLLVLFPQMNVFVSLFICSLSKCFFKFIYNNYCGWSAELCFHKCALGGWVFLVDHMSVIVSAYMYWSRATAACGCTDYNIVWSDSYLCGNAWTVLVFIAFVLVWILTFLYLLQSVCLYGGIWEPDDEKYLLIRISA